MGKAHGHGLSGGGSLIQQGGVGNIHSGEVSDHGLEVEEGLEPSLGNLGLVGGILGVPSGVFHQIPQDHGGGEGAIVTHPNVGTEDLVLQGDSLQRPQQLGLGELVVLRGREGQERQRKKGRKKEGFRR